MSELNRITGVIRTITPLHSGAASKMTGAGNTVGTSAVWVTTKDGQVRVGAILSNSLRGPSRRDGADLVLERLAAKGIKYPIELYGGLRRGAAQAKPSGDMSVGECIRARQNLFMGLFGGGARMFSSAFSISDMVTTTKSAIEVGMVPQSVIDSGAAFVPKKMGGEEYSCFTTIKFFKRDDLSLVSGQPELLANVTDYPKAFADYQDATFDNNQARKAVKADKAAGIETAVVKKTDMAGIFEFEVLSAGTPLYFQMDLADTLSDAQIGFMALILERFANRQKLGGMVRFGFGRFNANLNIVRNGEEFSLLESDGNGSHKLSAPAQKYADLANIELDKLTVEELLSFYGDVPARPAKLKVAA